MNDLLVDTNVLIYAIDKDSIFYKRSRNLLENTDYVLVTTSKNLLEFLTVTTRSSGYKLETEPALKLLDEIIEKFKIIYPSRNSMDIFLHLMKSYKPKGLKVHDFGIISIGLTSGIHKVATINKKDFRQVKKISLIDF